MVGSLAVPGTPFRHECPEGSKVVSASAMMDVSGDMLSGEPSYPNDSIHTNAFEWHSMAHHGCLGRIARLQACAARADAAPELRAGRRVLPHVRACGNMRTAPPAVRVECDNAPGVRSLSLEAVAAAANALVLNTTAQLSAGGSSGTASVDVAGRKRYISPELIAAPPRTAYHIQASRGLRAGSSSSCRRATKHSRRNTAS